MKKFIIVKMVCWASVAVILTLILVTSTANGVFVNELFTRLPVININGNTKKVKEYTFKDIKSMEVLNIEMNSEDVIISENSEENIKVIVKSNKKMDEDYNYIDISKNSNSVNIKSDKTSINKILTTLGNGYSMDVEVFVPKGFNGDLIIQNKVGDIDINSDLNMKSVQMTNTTGDLNSNKTIKASSFEYICGVGDVDLTSLDADNINIQTKTGDVDIKSLDGKGKIQGSVGDIECYVNKLKGNLAFKSNLGDIDVDLKDDISFKVVANKKIANIDTNFDFDKMYLAKGQFTGEYGKNPSSTIDIETNTGDISINK